MAVKPSGQTSWFYLLTTAQDYLITVSGVIGSGQIV